MSLYLHVNFLQNVKTRYQDGPKNLRILLPKSSSTDASFVIDMNANTESYDNICKDKDMFCAIYIMTIFFVSAGNYILKDVKNLSCETFNVQNILCPIKFPRFKSSD